MSADNYRDCPKCGEDNFREDYEIYSEYDEIYFRYYGSCKKCGYKQKYEIDKEFENVKHK